MRKPSVLRRTTAICLIFGSLLGGIILGRFGLVAGGWAVSAAVIVVLGTLRTRWVVGALMVLALLVGLWRNGVYQNSQNQLVNLIGQKVTVVATISDDPGVDPRGFENYKLNHLVVDGRPMAGQLNVYMYVLQVQRGYQIQATGKVVPGYGNMVAELSYPQVTILSRRQSWLEQAREGFFSGMRTALPEPMASFGLGLLIGIRALIPKDMQTTLTLVGLSHLVAVSGYNLTIIVQAVDRLLARFGRGIALVVSLWLIVGFLIVTGAGASIVRASLVAVLSLMAGFYGRRFNPLALILIAAGVTAAYKPDYLTDLGWLLSFLAFFGILVMAPAVEARLGNPKPVLIRLLIESLTAQLLTIPLILYQFDQLSIISPISNLVILPMVPLAMLFGFIAGLAGMLLPAFCGWFAWPADLLMKLMISMIDQFAAVPWAGRTEQISFTAMLAMYGLILLITIVLKQANVRRGVAEESHHLLEPVQPANMPS